MKILLIRHAEPDYEHNTLTPQGFKEAEALGEAYRDLAFDEVYTSPMNRAKLTAEAVMKYHSERSPVVVESFAELDTLIRVPYSGKMGLAWDFLPAEFVKEEPFFTGEGFFSSAWLQNDELKARYRAATRELDQILAENGYHRKGRLYEVETSNTKTVLIFCHFGMMSVLMSHLLNIPFVLLAQQFECQPTGVTTLVTEERQRGIAQFRCLRFSDVSHLTSRGIEPSFAGRFCEIFDSDDRH